MGGGFKVWHSGSHKPTFHPWADLLRPVRLINCDLLVKWLCKHSQGDYLPHTVISLPDRFMEQMSFLSDQRLQR